MTQIATDLRNTEEAARRLRFEVTGNVTATDVQEAIEQVDAGISGKVGKVGTIRLPASAANVAILATDVEVGIDTRTTAVTAQLPNSAAWLAANPGNGLELTLVDINGNASVNNITPALDPADAFAYGGVTPVIFANYGSLRLRPMTAPPGWYVRGVN